LPSVSFAAEVGSAVLGRIGHGSKRETEEIIMAATRPDLFR